MLYMARGEYKIGSICFFTRCQLGNFRIHPRYIHESEFYIKKTNKSLHCLQITDEIHVSCSSSILEMCFSPATCTHVTKNGG